MSMQTSLCAILTAVCALSATGGAAQTAFRSLQIRTTDGQLHSYDITRIDSITFDANPSVQQCKWYHTLENPGVADYLRDFAYDAADYSYHHIFDYRGEPYLDARQDWPYGVTLGDTTYYNLIPGRSYTLQYVSDGARTPVCIQTLGQLRMIRAEGIDNVRDLGGWPTADGCHVRYGMILRGTEANTCLSANNTALHSAHQLTQSDRELFSGLLGIRAELDLRSVTEIPVTGTSAFGTDIDYLNSNVIYTEISSADSRARYLECLRYLISELQQGKPVYVHCIWGADRTGILCMLLEGLLGVCQSDLDKDWELTSFSGNTRYRTDKYYTAALSTVLAQDGANLQQKFRHWWLQSGATDDELDTFIDVMTE